MTREIKFRAWDKDLERMLDMEQVTVYALNNTHNPVMQFTGLKDKNGKEIYEGDIIQAPYESEDEYAVPCVETGIFKGEVIYLDAGFKVKQTNDEYTPSLENTCIQENWEIIGNIYENNKLLL